MDSNQASYIHILHAFLPSGKLHTFRINAIQKIKYKFQSELYNISVNNCESNDRTQSVTRARENLEVARRHDGDHANLHTLMLSRLYNTIHDLGLLLV